jgi:hypothetical protein
LHKISSYYAPLQAAIKNFNRIVFLRFIAKNALALRKENVYFQFVNFSSVSIQNGKSLERKKNEQLRFSSNFEQL